MDGSGFEIFGELDQGIIIEAMELHAEEPLMEGNFLERFDPSQDAYIKLSVLMKNDNLGEVPEEFVFSKDFGRVENSQIWRHQDRVIFGRDAQPSHR